MALPASMRDITMSMVSGVPINVGKPVSYSDIVSRDSNGNPKFDPLRVERNKIYFPSGSAGLPNSYVRVNWTDNTSSSYTITSGTLRQVVMLEVQATSSFANVRSFTNPAIVSMTVTSVRGVGITPLFEISMTTAGNVVFDITTSDGKRPVKCWGRVVTGTTWNALPASATGVSTISLPVGTIYIVPEWSPSDFTEAPRPVSTGGGGGG